MLKDRDEVENERLRMKEGRSNQPIQGELERAKKNTRRKGRKEGREGMRWKERGYQLESGTGFKRSFFLSRP